MGRADKYTYRISWSGEDDEFIATVAEFPSLSWLDANYDAALDGAVALVDEVFSDMEELGEAIPVPFSERKLSGKFPLRITPEKHRALAIEAAEQGVSPNRLVAARI